MKNLITEYYKNISDADLKLAIAEIKESDVTGYIGDIVRNNARNIFDITNHTQTSLDLTMVQICLMKEASFRWLKPIETYTMSFNYFDGAEWKNVEKEIFATSMIQLIRTFIEETHVCNAFHLTTRQYRKEIWNDAKRFIEKCEPNYPIVKYI
jgi:hypothetical protein